MKRVALIVVTAIAAACGGSTMAPAVVAAPTGTVTTETFTGTVNPPVGGVLQHDSHNFTVAVDGSVTVTLTSAGPPPTIKMGLSVGTPASDGSCTALQGAFVETPAGITGMPLSGMIAAGTYCVDVLDTGNVLQAVAYTVTVSHT